MNGHQIIAEIGHMLEYHSSRDAYISEVELSFSYLPDTLINHLLIIADCIWNCRDPPYIIGSGGH